MVLNRQRHTDDRHRGDAGRNEPGGLAGLDDNGAIEGDSVPASIRTNIALNAFRIAINGSLTRFNLQDGVIDDFQDDSGVLQGSVSSGTLTRAYAFESLSEKEMTSGTLYVIETTVVSYAGNALAKWQMKNSIGGVCYTQWYVNGSPVGTQRSTSNTNYQSYSDTFAVSNGDTVELKGYEATGQGQTKNVQLGNETYEIISVAVTAEAQPTNIHAVILADDAAITLNTDLKAFVSVDNGATWEQITLEDSGDYSATAKILTGSVAVAGTGTTIKYKIECTDTDFEFYAVGLLWD